MDVRVNRRPDGEDEWTVKPRREPLERRKGER